MYENTPSPLNSATCLNRAIFLTLGVITLFWIVYLVVMPPDPSLGAFGPVLYRLVSLGIAAAWIFSLAASGLMWIVAQLRGRRE
jgi:hypothetical protein